MSDLSRPRIPGGAGDMTEPLRLDKLDFDALMDDAEKNERYGECPLCEFDGDTEPKYLCWCGVCLKYHHDDYFHEDPVPDYPGELLPGGEFVK